MKPSLPSLVVFHGEVPPEVAAALDAAEIIHRPASLHEAAESVNGGWADLVVCGRVPGWPALMTRVQTAGGGAVLFGEPPTAVEQAQLGAPVHHTPDASRLPAVISDALEQAHRRRMPSQGDPLAERQLASELIGRFAQSIALQIDLPHMVQEAIARTRDLCDADGASVLLVRPESGELVTDNEPCRGVVRQVARTATPLRIERVSDCPFADPESDGISGFRTGSVIAVPLLLGGDLFGVIDAVRGEGRPPFEEAHLRRLCELAPHVTVAVYNAQITTRLRETQAQVLRDNAELEARISERTAQIARGKREWEATFDAIDEPIAMQEGFVVRRANLAYARQAGVRVTEVPGRTCHELLAGRSNPCVGCPLVENRPGDLGGEVSVRGGASFQISGFRLPSAYEGGVVLHYRDVTRQKALEDRLRESERLASLGQLASGAAHEINNPLGFLVSNLRNLRDNVGALEESAAAARDALHLLRSGKLDDAVRVLEKVDPDEALASESDEMITDSLEGARRVGEIVRGLRELSRQQITRSASASVNAALTRLVRSELDGANVQAVLDLQATRDAAVEPLQLDQALGHVLRNARQAIAAGQRVYIETWSAPGEVSVRIRDEGCGIAPENLRRLFEPFFTTRGVGEGIGLGLTATWGIVRRHGGYIDVRSEPGRGTTFTLTFPSAPGAPLTSEPELATPGGDVRQSPGDPARPPATGRAPEAVRSAG